jgi:RNA polymerase primary sigma factor
VKTMAGSVGRPAGTTGDRHADTGRAVWLRERLAELARNLGRVPNTNELSSFILRYQVDPAEINALVGDGGAKSSSRTTSAAPSRPRAVSIPEARGPIETTPPRLVPSPAVPPVTEPASSALADIDSLPTPEVVPTSDKVLRRAVDDLVDDWFRAGRELHYDDVTRLTTKRGLTAEQTAAILEELDEQGVEVAGLRTELRVDGDLVDDDLEGGEGRRRPSAAVSDLVRAYLLKIGKYPLIWAEDEVRLGRQIRLGLDADEVLDDESRRSALSPARLASLRDASAAGRRAHSEMVCANLRLVVSIAKHRSFEGCGVEFIDRVQDGNAGLMHAADKFDPTLGYKFSTYATWWIRQAISRGIGDRGRLIRIPVHVHEKLSQMRRVRRDLVGRLDRDPTTTELADALDWPAATVQAMLDHSRPIASLDVLVGTEGDTTLGDLLSDQADIDGRTDPVNCVVESACARDLDRVLADLPERSAEVVRRRFGLHGRPEQTLDEIGLHFGVTRERIRQIEAKAMDRLKQPHNLDWLRCYLYEDFSEQPPAPPDKHAQRLSAQAVGWTSATAVAPVLDGPVALEARRLDGQLFLFDTVSDIVDAS